MKERVLVAMSGGVDSAVAAALLVQQGYEVIGVTLQLYDSKQEIKSKTCCSGIDIYDAKDVALLLFDVGLSSIYTNKSPI